MRVWDHPILGPLKKTREVTFYFCRNGKCEEVKAFEWDTVASALLAAGYKIFRYSDKYHEPRSVFCAIGLCNSCIMIVDGQPNVRTCITPVKDGMKIEVSQWWR